MHLGRARFVVLGSSIGDEAFVARWALGAKRVLGIELVCDNVRVARSIAAAAMHATGKPASVDEASALEFRCADALEVDYSGFQSLLIYVDDALWRPAAVRRLAAKLPNR